MAFFVNEERNIKENKAVKEFTDRVEPRNVFWKKYNLIKDSIKTGEEVPIQIITYYGIGGTGKTRLLERIRYEVDQKEKETKYCYIDFEKLKYLNNDILSILNAIKSELNRKYKFEFPLFDLAAYEYRTKLGMPASKPELENVLSKNKELSFLMGFVSEIPLVGTFAKIVSMVDEGTSILRNRFKDMKLKSRIENLDGMNIEELENLLPYYFAVDFQENIKNDNLPFVFQLDTYERLVNELTQVGSITKIDNWLKSEDGLIRNIHNVLWVIAGREKLKWEEEDENWKGNLDQHLLGDLSEADSMFFLKSAGIEDEELISQIYKMTCGTPVFLDMCVDTYYRSLEQNKKPTIQDFSGDKLKLIDRFFTYMNDTEKDFVTVLAFIGNWTDDIIEDKIKPVLGNFSFSLYEKIKQFSFIIQEGEQFKIHETIRDVIVEEASPIIKKKFNQSIQEKQEEKIKKIEEIETVEEIEAINKEDSSENLAKQEAVETKEEKNETQEDKKELKEEIRKEKPRDIEKAGAIYIQNFKKQKYKEVIDEIVTNIIEFLYKKPKFTKSNKQEYCDMINNLLDKIEQYLEIYDGRYEPKKIEPILNYKIFKNTYEYKRLSGLYICLRRYYDAMRKINNERYGSGLSDPWGTNNTSKDTILAYKKTKNLYKEPKQKAKQISYIMKFLGDGCHTIATREILDNYSNHYFTYYELDTYEEILKEHKYQETDIENILIYYTRRNYKKFKQSFDKFYEENKDTDNIYYKRLMVRFALSVIYEEFKGKPGTGYLMRDHNLHKQASQELRFTKIAGKEELEEEIKKLMTQKKVDFINEYLDRAMTLINKNKSLIDACTIELFVKVAGALCDEPIGNEIGMKIFNFFIETKNEILESNNILMIEKYGDLIYHFGKFDEIYTLEFLKDIKEELIKLEDITIKTLDELSSKLREIMGGYSPKANEFECKYKVDLLLNHYGRIEEVISIYNKHRNINTKNDYFRTDNLIRAELCKKFHFLKPYYKTINKISAEILIKLFEAIYEDYEHMIHYYFEKCRTILDYEAKSLDEYWQEFIVLPMAIYAKTGNISYFAKVIDLLYEKVKNYKTMPTLNIYVNLRYWVELVWEYSLDKKNEELVDYSFKLFEKVFGSSGVSEFVESDKYNALKFRYDMGLYTSIILSKIAYNNYMSKKDKDIYEKMDYCRRNDGGIKIKNGLDLSKNLNLYLYREINIYSKYNISYMSVIYEKIQNKKPKVEIDKKVSLDILKDVENIKSWIDNKKLKDIKEFAQLVYCLYNAVLGTSGSEERETLEKIVKGHTKGLFKEKEDAADYIQFKNAIDAINSYKNKDACFYIDTIRRKINEL